MLLYIENGLYFFSMAYCTFIINIFESAARTIYVVLLVINIPGKQMTQFEKRRETSKKAFAINKIHLYRFSLVNISVNVDQSSQFNHSF